LLELLNHTIALMHVSFRVETCIFYHNQYAKAAKMKRISTCDVPEDENKLVQTRLGGEFWAIDVINA